MAAEIETNPTATPSDANARRAFILRHGVLEWGLTTGLAYAIVMHLTSGPESNLAVWLAFSLVAFPIGGIVWGHLMWRFRNRFGAKPKAN